MEVIAHDRSSLTALFLAGRQQGQLPIAYAAGELIKRYNFVGFPTNIQQLEAQKIEFKQGAFRGVGIESFDIYNDGVVIASKSPTDVLDEFLIDVCEWMETTLGLKRIETHTINRNYESSLLVRSDSKLLQMLDALQPIQDLIAKSVKSATGIDAKFEPFGITLAVDQSRIAGMKPGAFRIERRVGLAFDKNYYVSQAPLRSSDHVKVLEKLEKLAQ